MVNERITEDIVREHFKGDPFYNNIVLEEQISSVPKINKLLQNASKKGYGKGKPEFIIRIKEIHDLLILVECKADVLRHESEDRNRYSEYAVDGVLLYSSYLSKEYNVLSIAVSGMDKRELKVSYFIQRKLMQESERIFGNTLLSIEDIISGITQDQIKRKEKYENLLNYSKILNEKLHSLKIKEDKRSLLVSGILISLKNPNFYRDYSNISSSQILANFLLETIKEQLNNENLQNNKIDRFIDNYSFIKNHTSLIKEEENVLKDLIYDIDENINSYARTYKYYDILGQFYIEFLRYSNSDKGLGIVLTPPHITDFFCDLADIKPDDIIYDNCTGTSGFLVSAMKKMIEKSHGDLKKEKNIKENQLYGTEYQPEIYPLAVSNMFLHGDGKSNIFLGSCFDEDIIEKIKEIKPNIAFLNPPYKSNKKQDKEELEFILNALDCLIPHGICIAIVPMSCVLAQKGKRLKLKEIILKNHTLKAVLSMPNELFFNSKVNTNTCIIVIEAKVPHSSIKTTFLGYFKDDGFSKKKDKGRYDYNKKWDSIKNNWIDLFINNKSISGLSITKKLSYKDEWCAEEYLETSYTNINDNDFKKTIKDYCIYKLASNKKDDISSISVSNNSIKLNINNWNYFNLTELFKIKGSKTTPPDDIPNLNNGIYPYVTTQASNNGVSGFYDFYTEEGNVITIDSAVLGYAAYQEFPFLASDHVEKLIPKFLLNPYIAMFLVTILNKEQYRYGYGRKASQKRLKKSHIKLPSILNENNKYEPDWEYMENYIKSLPYSSSI
ncbi:N-6 DNA methylase [uncultured Brachyspira sp.]|uniref:N-6 DNA methylase n=1 Tax=uncultured Brachyspira sp. TaxID=221953 RepID=UPI00260E5C5E|nr:N-6 DNA methylase [uncultured Brachyspira sp.]